jgi:tetratricopeptide (TPR) repeat protein
MTAGNLAAATRLAAALAGLVPALGCVSTPKEDPEQLAKRANSHFEIAVDHMQNGRVEMAVGELFQAAELDPDNPRIQHGLGIALLQKGKVVEAEARLRRALEIRPDYHDARYNLSTLQLNLGRYRESLEQARILYDDPTFPSPWRALTILGWAEYKLGRVEEARRHLVRARLLGPRYWPALLDLGILEAEQGNPAEAARYFDEVLVLDPGPSATAEASYRLAEIYVSQGRRQEAVGHLRAAVVKAPDDPWGKKSEEYLKLLR